MVNICQPEATNRTLLLLKTTTSRPYKLPSSLLLCLHVFGLPCHGETDVLKNVPRTNRSRGIKPDLGLIGWYVWLAAYSEGELEKAD